MNFIKTCVPILIISILIVVFARHIFCQEPADDQKIIPNEGEKLIREKDYAGAEALFANYANSTNVDTKREGLYGLGRIYFFKGDLKNAQEYLGKAFEIDKTPPVFLKMDAVRVITGIYAYKSYIFTIKGDYAKAIEILNAVISKGWVELCPDNMTGVSIYSSVARNYLLLGDIPSALKFYKKSYNLKIVSKTLNTAVKHISLMGLGKCSLLSGKYADARDYYLEAVKTAQGNNALILAAYSECTDAYLFLGEYEKAYSECVKKIQELSKSGGDLKSYYNLGIIYAKTGKIREARESFNKIFAQVGANPTESPMESFLSNFYSALAHYNLGLMLYQDKDPAQALVEMRTAADLIYKDPRLIFYKTDAQYLFMSVKYNIIKMLKDSDDKDSAEKEQAELEKFINGLPAKEKKLVESKIVNNYIEGPSWEEINKK